MELSKRECRALALARRDAMTADERADASQAINERVAARPAFQNARRIMLYATMRGEVDTAVLIGRALAAGQELAVPVTIWEEHRLLPVRLRDPARLIAARHGVPEPLPEEWEPIEPDSLDLLLVPGVAFDRAGYRLGYGAGLFDGFLAGLGPTLPRWGLAFDVQVMDRLPVAPHDQRVHAVVTQRRWIDPEPRDE
ncbi:MAG: 5-formyltetrahydrofolate cyclo-ligase [Armatimonadetes bacterium]|nr:5-formyltetrahydrofolate cyclo-ligase [Armatimonadota bacterium]